MSLILPEWVKHHSDADDKKKRQTIYSIHVHPDGSRLATGGIDQKIRIWATDPMLDDQMDKAQDINRLLCTMTRHTGPVMVVRWSASGRFLASGSDDTICLIWELDPTMGATDFGSFGSSSTEKNVETWRTHRRLAAHESDVVDLAWSTDQDDTYLATVGLDSRVIVWSGPRNAPGGGFERIRVIDGHEGFVKGVVWDPIGEYLATASDDKTVKFWRVGGSWSHEKTITKPYESSPGSTFFRRASWSPDGAHVLCSNATSGTVFVANVIQRQSWEYDIYLVGHENAVVVTAFSPRLFYDTKDGSAGNLVTVLALGSSDQSISVWITGQSRPVLVARDVFQRGVMDLSWSTDGMTLYACSADGYVAVFAFTAEDLRPVAPDSELLKAREAFEFTEKQRVFRQKAIGRVSTNGLPASSQGTAGRPNMLVARKAGVPRATPSSSGLPPPASGRPARLQQQITITRDGKRRIKPTLMNGSQPAYPSQDHFTELSHDEGPTAHTFAQNGMDVDGAHVSPYSSPPPKTRKRTASVSFPDNGEVPVPPPSAKKIKDVGRTLGGDLQRENVGPSVALRAAQVAVSTAAAGVSNVLSMPSVLSLYRKEESAGTIEVRNFEDKRASEIYHFDPGTTKSSWMDFSSTGAALATISENFSAISFEDGSLAVYSVKGRRLCSIQLEAPCHRLESYREYLIAITTDGQMRRWNIRANTEIGRPLSVLPLFSSQVGIYDNDEILHFWVHSNGLPVLIMRSERAFTLDAAKMAWTLISSGWFADCSPVWEGRTRGRGASMDSISGGGLSSTRRDPIRAIESTINDLVVIQRSTSGIERAEKPPSDRLEAFNAAVMLKHLEARLTAAALLDSAAEYKAHLQTYARKLSEEGIRNQAEDLCKSLLGPIYYNTSDTPAWAPTVCGLQKRDLLAEILRTMGRSRLLLGLVSTYQDLLKNVHQEW